MAGLSWTVLSQVSLVNGLGSSCSQPRFAKLPSWTVGSARRTSSRPDAAGPGAPMAANTSPAATAFGGNALPATTPSCTDVRQKDSASSAPAPAAACTQVSRTTSYAARPGVCDRPISMSCADLPP